MVTDNQDKVGEFLWLPQKVKWTKQALVYTELALAGKKCMLRVNLIVVPNFRGPL